MVACPQWAIWRAGVKNSSRRVAFCDAETNAVSDRPTCRAIDSFWAGVSASASSTTPAGLPPPGASGKALTM